MSASASAGCLARALSAAGRCGQPGHPGPPFLQRGLWILDLRSVLWLPVHDLPDHLGASGGVRAVDAEGDLPDVRILDRRHGTLPYLQVDDVRAVGRQLIGGHTRIEVAVRLGEVGNALCRLGEDAAHVDPPGRHSEVSVAAVRRPADLEAAVRRGGRADDIGERGAQVVPDDRGLLERVGVEDHPALQREHRRIVLGWVEAVP